MSQNALNGGNPPSATPSRSAAMRFILIAVLIDMISVGLILPVFPSLVGQFTDSPDAQAWWFGAAALAYGVANFFGASILGALSDRYGRRPVLLIGFAAMAINFFAIAAASAVWMLVLIRLFTGFCSSNAAVANAYVADISNPAERAKRFGMLGAMFGLGFIIGPALGGWLGDIHLHLPFYVSGGAALLNLAYGFFVLPESLPAQRRREVAWWTANPFSALRKLGLLHGVGPLVWVMALSGLAQFMLHTTWALYTHFRFQWGPHEVGLSLMAVGLASALVQGGLLPRLIQRWGMQRVALIALISGTLAYLAWGLTDTGWVMVAIIGLNLVGFSATVVLQTIVSNAAPPHVQGETLGARSALSSAMAALAPAVAAPLLAMVAHLPPHDWRLGTPFYVCAALQGIAAFVAWRHFQKHPVPDHA